MKRHVAEGRPAGPLPHLNNSRGMALVLTLMVVAIITAMVVEFAYGVYTNTTSLYNWQISQELSLAARSGTKLAARLLTESYSRPSAFPGSFEISQKIPYDDLDGTITLRIEDENAKFNLNSLNKGINLSFDSTSQPYDMLQRLLTELQLDPEIGRRIAYWLDTGTEHRPSDSEALSKNTPLDSVDELLLIPGIDEKTYDKLLPYVTIYGNKVIDINTAGVPALMAADSRMTKDVAERIVQYRQLTPFSSSADLEKVLGFSDTGISSGKFMVTGGAFRVLVTAESAGIKRTVECVLEGSAANWKVTYWKET